MARVDNPLNYIMIFGALLFVTILLGTCVCTAIEKIGDDLEKQRLRKPPVVQKSGRH